MTESLSNYYFAHREMFLIPIEHMSANGMSSAYRDFLLERALASSAWIDLFNQSFTQYYRRASELAGQAPHYWLPPRLQHACIVTDPKRARPYSQPLNKCSWLLYATDFEPTISNREFATFQFFQAERLGMTREVISAFVKNLSYWLVREDEEIEEFCAGCRQASRPDAAAYRAIAEAIPWILRLSHESMKKPILASIEPLVGIPQTGLLIPRSLQANLNKLVQNLTTVAQEVMTAFLANHQSREKNDANELCAWLRESQPKLLITGPAENILWDPEKPDEIDAVRAALGGSSKSVIESIREDLRIIDERSRSFLDSLRRPDDLPELHTDMEESGLSYLHVKRRLIAYNLLDPLTDRRRQPSPPYERYMLAARTIHEWGHQAVDAGMVPIAENRRVEYDTLFTQLSETFDEIYHAAPANAKTHAAGSIARLAGGDSPGLALARVSTNRMCDFQANLLSQNYLNAAERETYIRNNVCSLAFEYANTDLFQRLARYVYEYQYLRFSRIDDPFSYFMSSTWFGEQYLKTGILNEDYLKQAIGVLGKLCDCFTIDCSYFADRS